MKIFSVEDEMFHADGQTDMTKLINGLRNFANVTNKVINVTTVIHLAVCLTTGPKLLPNRALHIARPRASSFKCKYPLLSLRSSSSVLRFLPRLPVTSIPHFIFPSITLCRRQFLRRM